MSYPSLTSLVTRNLTSHNATTTTTTNTTLPALCELSPHARALSTVLTAFVGSIITGVTSGYFTAFHAAWVCWLSPLRILLVGTWAMVESLQGHPLEGGAQFHDFYGRLPGFKQLLHGFGPVPQHDHDSDFEGTKTTDPSVLGWLGWLWSTIWSPIVQTLWLTENWTRASGSLKLVRAIGVALTALPLTMDVRGRFGAALGFKIGRWGEVVFNLITATSCLMLGIISTIEFILAAIEIPTGPVLTVFYILFMLFWTKLSLGFAAPIDQARSADGLVRVLGGLAMGVVSGVFTAIPAFIIMQKAQTSPGDSLAVYLKCESVAVWQKMVAILP